MTLIITMICHYAEWNYAECRILFSILLSVIVLSVTMLNVINYTECRGATDFVGLLYHISHEDLLYYLSVVKALLSLKVILRF
jgi:hypothetical protein